MKKILSLCCFAMLALCASAQITAVNYRGAFAPAPTPMWTDGWANWDPKTTTYGATNTTVTGHITTNTTWTKDKVYLLSGVVYIDSLATLTIEPGTVIRGDHAVPNSCLIAKRGGKLNAIGTAANPIVFTSNLAAGSRAKGDWGGVILLGRAKLNVTGGVNFIEGLAVGDPNNAFGGNDDADNSGTLKYVRIEFGGYVFAPNAEINGLTFGAVGSGTTIDNIQVSYSNDDSYEWFGGTVNATHLVAYRGLDDDFDTDNGFSGKVQFGIAIRDPQIADDPSVSTSEGFESDNDANGSTNTPQTSAVFSNMTIIGPYRGNPAAIVAPGFRRGARLRRNTAEKIFNSIFMDNATGLFIDGAAAYTNAINGLLKYKNNLVALAGPTFRVAEADSTRTIFFAAANKNDSLPTTVGVLVTPYNFTSPDYRPAPGSQALNNYDFTDPAFGPLVSPTPITAVNYRGAFAPAPTPMWTDGWANWDPKTTTYGATNTTVTGHITTNTTWTKDKVYLLSGVVYIDSLATLTIEPGTVIRGDHAVPNSCLIAKRGGKLNAIGTAANPIVFTSNLAAGSRAKGDWGGVILLGRAKLNVTGGVNFIEGLAVGDPNNAFGGNDDADNSGTLKYVRIEFGGYVFAPNAEINGLTFGAVGSGTTIDNIQVSYSNDDSYEWFGGTVNATHLVAYRGLDDDFDTDNGFSGKVQFGIAIRDPQIADDPSVSTSEGFESDNDANGSTNTPQTSAVFSNMTIIGPYRGNPAAIVAPGFRRGARLRRNTAEKIFNSIFMDNATGLFIDGAAAYTNAINGKLKFKNNLVALAGPNFRVAEADSTRTIFFAAANKNDSLPTTVGVLITPYNFTSPDYRPGPGSPALVNYDFTDGSLPVTLTDFTGTSVKADNILLWKTSTEINNDGFELQRSTDGNEFTRLAYIPSKAINGNSSVTLSYSYSDVKASGNTFYYRLKQVDKDGRYSLSKVVILVKQGTAGFLQASVYPNPVADNVNVTIVSSESKQVTLVFNDVFGRPVIRKVVNLHEGTNTVSISTGAMAKGNYFLNVISADGKNNGAQKIIKN